MPPAYSIPAKSVVVETEAKKSRFITYIAPAANRAEALEFIKSIRQKYPDARYHCTAFIAGPPEGNTAIAFDDDGEPSGTAGRPMLNVLMHKKMGEVVAVVVRYFGGIKLGAGGLVRAYGSAVQTACDQLPLAERVDLKEGELFCEYAQEQKVRHCMDICQVKLLECHYGETVAMMVAAPEGAFRLFCQRLSDVSQGRISVKVKQ